MEKIWLKHYPSDIPSEIDKIPFRSLVDLFEQRCRQYTQKTAYINFGCQMSYARLEKLSRYFAAYLEQMLDHQKGDRIAIMLPNILQYPVALFGALRAGLIVVNINPLYKRRELLHQLQDSGATTILVLENVAHVLEQVLSKTQIKNVLVTKMGDLLTFPTSFFVNFTIKYIKKLLPKWNIPHAQSFKFALQQGEILPFSTTPSQLNDIAFLQYTGGTTGVAKGAELTHANMLANILQVSAWFRSILDPGNDVILAALPLFHIFSLTAHCLVFLYFGGCNVLISNPRNISQLIRSIRGIRLTAITGVNTLFNALLNHKTFARLDFSQLKLSLGGGAKIEKNVAQRWEKVTKKPLLEAYGLTETAPAVAICPPTQKEFNGSVGLPLPSTEISIRDDKDREIPIGKVGELCIRGPQVMRGYWQQSEETREVLSTEGWFKTGDFAKIDEDGFLYIVDRKKDMILVSGFNVYPNEIENVIKDHPGVAEAAAIGVPDERSGEAVKLFAVKKDPKLTSTELLEYCRSELSPQKVPKHIEFRTELPKSSVGKILRRELREEKYHDDVV